MSEGDREGSRCEESRNDGDEIGGEREPRMYPPFSLFHFPLFFLNDTISLNQNRL